MAFPKHVVVVIGCGGMGLAVARRLGSGSHLLLADFSQTQLYTAAQTLQNEGHDVETLLTDISKQNSVEILAQRAAQLGPIRVIAHTAGLSPQQAPLDCIYSVDLLGTAHVIDSFVSIASPGTSLVVIASLAGHLAQADLSSDLERHLATAPASALLSHPDLEVIRSKSNAESAAFRGYQVSKRGNILRVQASAAAWGKKGARINSISPGFILTPMGHQELAGPLHDQLHEATVSNPIPRAGTAADIANVVAFLSSPDASFITGTDLLVDGGWLTAMRWKE
ncbi:hypothetical protein BJY04DRAFT_175424 [Aspergillus karnatakaensis]|uniref:uncharacterized protein n=1 Tax=Aspergillus karnatakaensis TaxID=1810916 RepID=UPI003CCCE940